MNENGAKKPSFWERPEGTWGMVLPVLIIAGLLFFNGPILAGLTVLATTVGVGIAYIIIASIALIFIHGFFIDGWMLLRYQIFIKNLRKSIIDESPLTILKIWKEKAQNRMKQIRAGKDEVKGRVNDTSESLRQSKREFTEFQKQANALNGDPSRLKQFKSVCGKMAIAAGLVKDTGEQLNIMQKQYTRLNEAYTDLETMYEEMSYQEIALVRKFKNSGALDKVWGMMRGIFKGENEDDLMREEAIDSINNQYAERMGRVESAMDDCQGSLDEIKLKREINESDGVAMFNKLSGINVDQLLISQTPTRAVIDTVQTGTNSYAGLIK